MVVELHPHQQIAVDKMHNGCILYGDVGTGKTITSLGYYFTKVCGGVIGDWGSMRTPKDLVVITTAAVRDKLLWETQAVQFGVSDDAALSVGNVTITVDSWNNIAKYKETKNAFFIFDEQRVVGYGAWTKAFIEIAKHNEWVLLSATPGDTWLDYIPVFIANGWYRNKTDFVNQHVQWVPRVKYPKVQRYIATSTLVRRRNQVLVAMPYERHTKRHLKYIECDFNQDDLRKVVEKRWNVYEQRPLRDVAELFIVARKVVNSDASRLDHLRALMEAHPRLIVFYNFDYELEQLRTLSKMAPPLTSSPPSATGSLAAEVQEKSPASTRSLNDSVQTRLSTTSSNPSKTELTPAAIPAAGKSITSASYPVDAPHVTVAEWNGHKHDEVPTTERWLYLVQYRAGAEGWNCVTTDAMVFYSQTYSYRDWWQAHGRIDRLNTPYTDLFYYHLVSRSMIDLAIRKALSAKKSFNERGLKLAA